jgi:hypothetical protein
MWRCFINVPCTYFSIKEVTENAVSEKLLKTCQNIKIIETGIAPNSADIHADVQFRAIETRWTAYVKLIV